MKKVTVVDIQRMKQEKKKIVTMTAYDFQMARIIDKDDGYTEYQTTLTVNKATPALSQLSSPTIIVGAAATTLSGKISLGSLIPTGNVAITINAGSSPEA